MGIKIDEIVQITLVAIFGGFAGGFVTLLAIRWSTLKSLEKAKERLQTQLLYEEKKKALRELYRLVDQKYKTYSEFYVRVSSFLDRLESEFLPVELKSAIQTEFYELDKFMEDSGLAPPSPTDEEADYWVNVYKESLEGLTDWEKAEDEFEERLRTIKRSIKHLIGQHIKP